jgi:hypothetical protein
MGWLSALDLVQIASGTFLSYLTGTVHERHQEKDHDYDHDYDYDCEHHKRDISFLLLFHPFTVVLF